MGIWIFIFFVVLVLGAIKVPPRRHNPSTGELTEKRRRQLRKVARRARERHQGKVLPWFDNGRNRRKNKTSF